MRQLKLTPGQWERMNFDPGEHADWKDGMSFTETVAWFSSDEMAISSHPPSMHPLLCDWFNALNDALADDDRPRLSIFLEQAIDSRDLPDRRLAVVWTDWLVRQALPAALEALGSKARGDYLRRLAPFINLNNIHAARRALGAPGAPVPSDAPASGWWKLALEMVLALLDNDYPRVAAYAATVLPALMGVAYHPVMPYAFAATTLLFAAPESEEAHDPPAVPVGASRA